MHGFANCRKFKSPVRTVDFGSGQGHVNIHSTCRTNSVLNDVTVALRSTEIRPFEFREISTFGKNLNSSDSFPGRKFENRALTSCRPGAIISLSTISFDVHAKVAEEIDLEMCSYEQLSELQMLRDLDLDLGSSQGHVNIHSTCRTTRVPNRVTVASRATEIWPFEFCQISTLDKV